MTTRGNQTGYELPDAESVTYNPGFPNDGETEPRDAILIPGTDQDISRREKTTLGNYLSGLTAGRVGTSSPNSFTVPGGSNNTDGSAYTVSTDASSNQGSTLTLQQMRSAGTTEGTFSDLTRGSNRDAIRKFEDTKNSEYGRGQSPFKNTSIKNFSSNSRRKNEDGHSLLTSIQTVGEGPSDPGSPRVGEPPETVPAVQKKISEVIRSNRFNPINNPFVQDNSRNGTGYTIQKQMGQYDPNAYEVSEAKLTSVSRNILLTAAGIPDGKNFLPGIPIVSTQNMRVQSADVAKVTDTASVSAIDSLDPILRSQSPDKSFSRSEYTNDVTGRESYGVMSSPIEPFSASGFITDTRNLAVISGATLGFLGLVKIVETIAEKMRGETPAPDVKSNLNSHDFAGKPGYSLALGRRAIKSESPSDDGVFLWSSFANNAVNRFFLSWRNVVPHTEHSLSDCILRGLNILLDQIRIGSGGFIATIARVVSRGTYASFTGGLNTIKDAGTLIKNIFTGDFDGNFLVSATSLSASIDRCISRVEAFLATGIFKFIKILTQIGDRSLIAEREKEERESVSDNSNVALSIQASRISDFKTSPDKRYDIGSLSSDSLAWKHSASPSMYVLPANFRDAIVDFAAINKKFLGLEPERQRRFDNNAYQLGRINAERVKEMEDELEAEYMPFYFHDIRSNEIISFHAFLSDLSDGFTASYDSTGGYGRTDEIMTYKSTKRSISLSFFVAATSPDDLDVMYWNINKLVSMLYPQYSRGRAMKSGNDRFIQPFSQIPTASPLIRLRIGDIIKSNYSKFGIARLFGLGEEASVFSPRPVMAPSQVVEQQQDTAVVTPPPSPPPGPYSEGQIITVKPGIPTRNRFLDSTGDSIETVRGRLSTQQDPAAQVPETGSPPVIRRARPNVPVIPRSLRLVPPGTRAKIIKISVVDGKPRYKCDIIRLSISSRLTTRTVEYASTPVPSDRTSSFDSDLYSNLQALQSQEPMAFDPYQYSNYSSPERPEGNLSSAGQEQLISTGGQSFAGRVTRVSVLRSIRGFHYIDLAEDEIVKPRIRTSRENSDSATATNDEVTAVPRVPAPPAPPAPAALNLSDFLSTKDGPQANPVIKSFESTRGRGLAGFITDIKFDWNESTWETDVGNRAPKFMKINITFAPIHDLPLGLDSHLAMRSVAYNVGGLSKTIGDDVYSGDED